MHKSSRFLFLSLVQSSFSMVDVSISSIFDKSNAKKERSAKMNGLDENIFWNIIFFYFSLSITDSLYQSKLFQLHVQDLDLKTVVVLMFPVARRRCERIFATPLECVPSRLASVLARWLLTHFEARKLS